MIRIIQILKLKEMNESSRQSILCSFIVKKTEWRLLSCVKLLSECSWRTTKASAAEKN